MKIFIDFDDVLFNTRDFKKDLIDIFISNGVSEKQFIEESYWDGRYNLEEQIKSVEKKYNVNGKKLRQELRHFFKDLGKYVFSDVQSFLNATKEENLFLISYGDEQIQTEKIKQAGLVTYFDKIVITHDKPGAIRDILKEDIHKNEKTFFLDDRHKYIEEVKLALPKITTVLIKRVEGRYQNESSNMADIVLTDLNTFFGNSPIKN